MGNFFKEITGMTESGIGGMVSSVIDPLDLTGKKGEWAAEKATAATLEGQRAELDYLREINKMPMEYRDKALAQLFGAYAGTPEEQQAIIDRAKASPLYQEIIGGREAGEESIMRHAAATGGLRSGNVQGALYDYSSQLERQALTDAYGQQMQGLRGLAMIPTGEEQIGRSMRDIGLTTGLGITAGRQAQQAGAEQAAGIAGGILSMFI